MPDYLPLIIIILKLKKLVNDNWRYWRHKKIKKFFNFVNHNCF